MKARPLKMTHDGLVDCQPKEATHLQINIPGVVGELTLPVMIGGTRAGTGNWTWNGDVERVTLHPSVLVTSGHYMQQHKVGSPCWCTFYKENPEREQRAFCYRCHSWINDGIVKFLEDCSHELKGQNVPLLDMP